MTSSILHLDVGELAQITRVGFEHWIQTVEAQPAPSEAANVEKNLASLVRVIKTTTPRVDPAGIVSTEMRLTTSSE